MGDREGRDAGESVLAVCCLVRVGRRVAHCMAKARIALLEGERRSFDNVKLDLMRRIKMLEYALRVERYAFFRRRRVRVRD